MAAASTIPCPKCSQPLVLNEANAGRKSPCPKCGTKVKMPELPDDSAKKALPGPRAVGEKPKSLAIDPQLAAGELPRQDLPTNRPKAVLPSRREGEKRSATLHDPLLAEAAGTTPANTTRPKAALPTQRHSGRLDAAEQIPLPAEESKSRTLNRASLPGRRNADDIISKATPATAKGASTPQPEPEPEPVVTAPEPTLDSAEESPAEKKNVHRLARGGEVRLRPKEEVEGDPESAGLWGLDEDEIRRRRNRRLTVILASIFAPLLIILTGVWAWKMFDHQLERAENNPEYNLETPGGRAMAERDAAAQMIRDFLAADSVEKRAKFVRHPEITVPRMQQWHSDPTRPLKAVPVRYLKNVPDEVKQDEVDFMVFYMEEDETYRTRALAVERQRRGDGSTWLGLDWESFAGWSEISWKEFLQKENEAPSDYRVTVMQDTYYNFNYSDDSKYFCYKLEDPEGWAHCYGYTGLDSEAAATLNRLLRKQSASNGESIKVILRLRFEAAGKGRSQVWIDKVVQDGWVMP